MKIIVTGGAGFIGSSLVRNLLDHGHSVLAFDKLTYAGNLDSLREPMSHKAFRFQRGDICDVAVLRSVFSTFQPDAVMHLAAESHVDRSIDSPDAFVRTNVLGTASLLGESLQYFRELPPARSGRFRFLHVSTDEVFGSLGPTGTFCETTPYDPRSPYSASKAASDHLVRAWGHTYGLPVLLTNCSNNYGPRQFPEKLIPLMITKALRREALPVYGKGQNVRDWLFVDDHAEGLRKVLEEARPGESYNLGGGTEITNLDLVRQLCAVFDEMLPSCPGGHASLIAFVTDRPGHDFRYAMDCTKVERDLGWVPRESFATGLRKTVSWYIENQWWLDSIASGSYRGDRLGLGGVAAQNPAGGN